MKEIIIDSSLTVKEQSFPEFNPRYFFGIKPDEFQSVTNIDAPITHRNYLDYLRMCWSRHYGAIISPTILWNMVLNNLAFEVNKNPNKYKKYFTESDEKVEICVNQNGNLIDVALLIDGVSGKIPLDIMMHCFPKYSTDTEKAIIANYTAFLDMVSPYYNYSMYLCGIPKVKILGTLNDWNLFIAKCMKISEIIPEFSNYLEVVRKRIVDIYEDTCDYSQIFSLVKCGSGSQVEVSGWITDFYIEQPSVGYPENFISCIAKIDYHNYNDNKDYRLYAGVFTSIVEDGYLIPEFGNMYFRKLAVEPKDDVANTNTVNLTLTKKYVDGGIRVTENDFSKIPKQKNETLRIIDGNKILIVRKGK